LFEGTKSTTASGVKGLLSNLSSSSVLCYAIFHCFESCWRL